MIDCARTPQDEQSDNSRLTKICGFELIELLPDLKRTSAQRRDADDR